MTVKFERRSWGACTQEVIELCILGMLDAIVRGEAVQGVDLSPYSLATRKRGHMVIMSF